MDLELEALMAELMSLQETKSNPLSERTLIELLLKLPSLGLVFYQTTDGNEYMTQEALDSAILDTVKERGRVSLHDLPQIIGINLDVIEGRGPFSLQQAWVYKGGLPLIESWLSG